MQGGGGKTELAFGPKEKKQKRDFLKGENHNLGGNNLKQGVQTK